MGSYLAISNDAPFDTHCKVTVDHKALAIGLGIGAFMVTLVGSLGVAMQFTAASAAAALTAGITLGGGGTLLAAFSGPAFQVPNIAAKANNISPFTLASANAIRSELSNKKYVLIRAGERHVFGKYSLSLLRQAVCTRPIILSPTEINVEYIAAHMIWSGSTVDSTNTYRVQKLKAEHTVKNFRVACQPPGTKKDSSGQTTSPLNSNFLPTTTQALPTGQYGLQQQLGVPIEPIPRHLVADQSNENSI